MPTTPMAMAEGDPLPPPVPEAPPPEVETLTLPLDPPPPPCIIICECPEGKERIADEYLAKGVSYMEGYLNGKYHPSHFIRNILRYIASTQFACDF